MQSMAKFVEQRPGVVKAQKGGLAFYKVIVVYDDRCHCAFRAFLIAVAAGPRPRLLARTSEVIVQKQPDMSARRVANLPHSDIRMVDRDVLALDEDEAKQAARSIERSARYVVEHEIGLQLGLVEIVLSLTDFLGVVAPVPRRNRLVQPVSARYSLQRRPLVAGFFLGRLPNFAQQAFGRRTG